MPFVVLNVASPFAPVGPAATSEPEQFLTQLDSALVRAGHESIVIACDGSAAEGILISTPRPAAVTDAAARRRTHGRFRSVLQKFFERWSAELVHLHGADFYEYLPPPGIPALITLHLPPRSYPPEIFQLDRPQTFLHCVSETWRRDCPPCPYLLPVSGIADADALEKTFHSLADFGRRREVWENVLQKYFAVYGRLAGAPGEPTVREREEAAACAVERNGEYAAAA